MLDRRQFLLSGLALGRVALSESDWVSRIAAEPIVPSSSSFLPQDEEGYWAQVRRQFLIPSDVVYLNNGTMGSSPRPVLRAVFDAYEEIEKLSPEDPEDYPSGVTGARARSPRFATQWPLL